MDNQDYYMDDEFIINLTIDGTSYEEVEVKVTDPNKMALIDYNIQPGDHLHLISIPIAG